VPDRTPGGTGAAAASGLFRARVGIAVAALLATAAAIYALAEQHADFRGLALAIGVPALVWACGAYALLLSARLALIAASAPLLAWLWWAAVARATASWTGSYELTAVGAGFAAAGAILVGLELHALATATARGMDIQDAVRSTLRRGLLLGSVTVLAAGAGIAGLVYPDLRAAPAIALAALIAFLACWALPPLVASLLPFGESYFARMNRAREWRERVISLLAIFSVRRWALATLGIVAILAAIVYFDRAFPALWHAVRPNFPGECAALGLLAALATRNWRYVFSCGLTVFFSTLLGAWLALRLGTDSDLAAQSTFVWAGAVGAPLVYTLAIPLAAAQRRGEPTMIACVQALNQAGSPVLFLGLSAAFVLLAGAPLHGVSPGIALVPLAVLGGALKVFMALATLMDDWFPRRRSLEERYRAR